MAVSTDAALRMLRERGRQFVTRGMRDCQARANDALFALVEGAADADEQSRCMDAMRTWHGGRRTVIDEPAGTHSTWHSTAQHMICR